MLYAVLLSWGPNRDPELALEQEPLIGEHANYMRGLAEQGVLVMGGPYLDRTGGLAVLRADSLEAVLRITEADPGCRGGLLKAEVHPWSVAIMNLSGDRG